MTRYKPLDLAPLDGWGAWDTKQGRRVGQHGLSDTHWWARQSDAQAWCNRNNVTPARAATAPPRGRRRAG
jgi:hypothetical protein